MPRSRPQSLYDFIIAGAGTAGATAAQTLRSIKPDSSVLLLGQEKELAYHRPPLSKISRQTTGEIQPALVMPATRYRELRIDVLTDAQATSLDCDAHLIDCKHNGRVRRIQYGKLLIATGTRATPLNVPGAELAGVHYLRTLDDARAIAHTAASAKKAVVIGGSFIGMEIAGALRQMGLEVCLIEQGALLYKLHHPGISDHFSALLRQNGVKCLLGVKPVRLLGRQKVTGLITDQSETISCDMVVIGAGVTPNTEWLDGSGIQCEDGIWVNEFLQSSDPDVYAAGDVANAYHPVFRRHLRVEHWDNAIKQAKTAARNMAGEHEPFSEVSYFFSHVFDQSYNVLGLTEPQSDRIDRGDLASHHFETVFIQNNICQGFFTLGRAGENARAAETLIRDRVNLRSSLGKLARPEFSLHEVPGQVIFILQGGGAFGAFECGAVRALVEHDILADVVAGVSIGAFNGAIIASAREHAAEALDDFWHDLSTLSPELPDEPARRLLASNQVSMFGVSAFFEPRWMQSMFGLAPPPWKWTSLYDFSVARDLLQKYVDFPGLKNSPVRLMVTAVDVQTSEIVLFDSHVDDLSVDHIIASGSLPPAFEWVTINGRHYWDAGIISNSPLDTVLGRLGASGKQIYLIDLFTGRRDHLPESLMDVYSRREEIIFSERLRNDYDKQDLLLNHRKLIDQLIAELPEEKAQRFRSEPLYLQLMGRAAASKVTRITRETTPQNPPSRAYDFSRKTILQLIDNGYQSALEVLSRKNGEPE